MRRTRPVVSLAILTAIVLIAQGLARTTVRSPVLYCALAGGPDPVPAAQATREDSAEAGGDSTVHGERFTLDCGRCHTPEGWHSLRRQPDFDHAQTGFPLRGAHARAACRDCHRDLVFGRAGTECAGCHADVVHHGELGADCARCHDESDWRRSAQLRQEHQQTRFPLLGRHALIDCDACHQREGRDEYAGLPLDCVQCHAGDYAAARAPDHRLLGLPLECDLCHSSAHLWWSDAVFQHTSTFPLALGHAVENCGACHTPSTPFPDGQDCFGCHEQDYVRTTRPAHARAGFPTDCTLCHRTTAFEEVASYGHVVSGYRLQGRHADQICFACHFSGVYSGLPSDCYACHSLDYQIAQDPDHRHLGFSVDCEECHAPTDPDWHQPRGYDHPISGFAIFGRHAGLPCVACHGSGVYAGLPADCYSCHQADYDETQFPNHARAGFSTTCETCHTPAGWDQNARGKGSLRR
jgi:hypothetical protein